MPVPSRFRLPLLCLTASLLLPGCWMGDRYYVEAACPAQGQSHLIRLGRGEDAPPLKVPAEFRPQCSGMARHAPPAVIETSVFVAYPGFVPAGVSRVEDMRDGDLFLRISAARQDLSAASPAAVSDKISAYVQANETSGGFAPAAPLGGGLFLQATTQPGGADVYFDRDPVTGLSSVLVLCGRGRRCESQGVTADGVYHFSYVFTGIPAAEFPRLQVRVRHFVETLSR